MAQVAMRRGATPPHRAGGDAYGGLRAGERFGLRARRVDPLRRTITIAETLVDVGGHPYFGPSKRSEGATL